jgi:hypothetical protein
MIYNLSSELTLIFLCFQQSLHVHVKYAGIYKIKKIFRYKINKGYSYAIALISSCSFFRSIPLNSIACDLQHWKKNKMKDILILGRQGKWEHGPMAWAGLPKEEGTAAATSQHHHHGSSKQAVAVKEGNGGGGKGGWRRRRKAAAFGVPELPLAPTALAAALTAVSKKR